MTADRQRRSQKHAGAGEQDGHADEEPHTEIRGQDDEILAEPAGVPHARRPSERATSDTGLRRVWVFRGSAHGHLFGEWSGDF